ncbi:MAG: M20/M25/M40 family metallo-hydrolase [Clostridia bacterium]|nr:M20/M25/M40 family metallo-hydrolase [Clostridia bacterium]
MNYVEVIGSLTAAQGVTGNENDVSKCVMTYFKNYTDEVWRDKAGNVFGKMGEGKPVILVCAHMDEVGMMVTDIEDNGMLRIASVAGVDPRVLPGSDVIIHAKTGKIKAVVGAIPPHLLNSDLALKNAKKAYKMNELVCDTGLCADKVKANVQIGDFVSFAPAKPMELLNNRIAGKTLDDRALVAAEIRVMEILSKRCLGCTVIFCATVQEEKGSLGAALAAWGTAPDVGLAVDVCHATTPGLGEFRSYPIEAITISTGCNIHPRIFEMLRDKADEEHINYEISATMLNTGTDAWDMQIQRAGIRCGLISVPLRYMHTSVECISLDALENCARLMAEFIADFDEDWEEKLCFKD